MAMARKWIKKALGDVKGHPFREKAEAAGESTSEFASEHEHDKGKTGEQARLAKTLMGMRHKRYGKG